MTRRRKGTPATFALLALILIVFVVDLARQWLGYAPLAYEGAVNSELIRDQGQYWRLVTAIFLHAGLLHLFLNNVALFQLGRLFEIMFGTKRFVLIFFVSGILASIASMIFNTGASSVGASGAVFGILGALVSSIQRSPRFRRDRVARSIMGQCIFWIVVNIAIGLQVEQIDNAAHIGGLVAGLLLGLLLPHRVPPPRPGEVVIDVTPSAESGADPAARRRDRLPFE